MLSPEFYDTISKPLVELYERFETSVIEDIARHLSKMDYASAAWQVQRLNESAMLYDEILDRVAEISSISKEEVANILEKAGAKSVTFSDKIYKEAGLNPLPFNLSPAMARVLKIAIDRTNGTITNIVNTTAIAGQEAFISAADLAYMQVSTGTMSYTEAMREAVKKLSMDGLNTIQYAKKGDNVDVAVRRAILSSVGDTAAELQLERAKEMGCDLVQMSAHIGARPTHQLWQGKVFSISGTSADYPPFVESTGYGTITGFAGVNCRHSCYPFFGGISERIYKDEELKSYEKETVKYNGEELSFYEATQKQREIERNIRQWKRQASLLEQLGIDNTHELAKVREWQGRMREFTDQTGLIRQREREWTFIRK